MGKITRIVPIKGDDEPRVRVYIDGSFCVKMRKRVADAIGIKEGDEWDCDKLKETEKYIWKLLYSPMWKEEKKRIGKTKELINGWRLPVKIEETGFGVDSTDIIFDHPEEKGKADLLLVHEELNIPVISLEVTGTDHPRGGELWLRKDKIEYAQAHPGEDYWAAVHLKSEIFFVKPDLHRKYQYKEKKIKKQLDGRNVEITEYYVTFRRDDPEVHSADEFREYLEMKIREMEASVRGQG